MNTLETIKKYSTYILAVVIIVLLGYIIFSPKPTNFELEKSSYKRQIDSLNTISKSLYSQQLHLDSVITAYTKTIEELNVKVDKKNQEINKIHNQYETKIKNINKLSPSELSKFFADRYK